MYRRPAILTRSARESASNVRITLAMDLQSHLADPEMRRRLLIEKPAHNERQNLGLARCQRLEALF